MGKNTELDYFDAKIVHELLQDGRATHGAIANKVGLSQSSVQRRIRSLEEKGVIKGYQPIIDLQFLGRGLTVFAAVSLQNHVRADIDQFRRAIFELDEITEIHHIAGSFDYLLRIEVKDLEAYETFHAEKLAAIPGMRKITSYISLSAMK